MRRSRVFLLAGEPSGDMLGGRLMHALQEQAGDRIEFFGVGGLRMAQQGLISLFPMDELSLIGFTEILPHLPRLSYRLRQTTAEVARRQPDLALTIDSPGFALRLQRRLRGLPLQRVHYVAPQIWAWREGRASGLKRDLDHLLALLPFEPAFFQRHGVACTFVGHPIVEEMAQQGDGPRFRHRYAMAEDAPVLCLLPGSRPSEVGQHLPVLEQTVTRLWQSFPRLRVVLPTLPGIAPIVRGLTENWKVPTLILEDRDERFDAYAASWLAIAASGTVSLEAALAGLPLITIYKTRPLTAWLAQRLITVPHVNLVNLILNRPAVPELLQDDCTPDLIASSAVRLLEDEQLRKDQAAALAEAAALLGGQGDQRPSERAAEHILEILDDGNSGGGHDHG